MSAPTGPGMSEQRTFVIRRSVVVPLGLLVILTLALLVVCLVQSQPVTKVVLLSVLLLPLAGLFLESARRRLEIDADGIRAFRSLRNKEMRFDRVTALETVKVRNRVFMTLVAGDDEYLILSNSYADFPGLVRCLVAAVPAAAVTEETRQLADSPPVRHADVAAIWLAVMAMIYILVAQFQ